MKSVLSYLSSIIRLFSLFLLLPTLVAILYGESVLPFLLTLFIGLTVSWLLGLRVAKRCDRPIRISANMRMTLRKRRRRASNRVADATRKMARTLMPALALVSTGQSPAWP